jgi:hypothetical protein
MYMHMNALLLLSILFVARENREMTGRIWITWYDLDNLRIGQRFEISFWRVSGLAWVVQ